MKERKFTVFLFSFLVATFFVVLNSDSTSPLLFAYSRWMCLDSDIFQYVGYTITKGQIPYTDIFDHKGLLLYWIEALGYIINPSWGVCVLQVVNLSATIFLWNKILSGISNLYLRWCSIFLCLLALYAYYNFGNLTEEWSLLPITYPFWLYFKNLRLSRTHFFNAQLLIIGLCVGILVLIRPNNVAPVMGLLLYCLFASLWKKDYMYIVRSLGLIFIGFLIPIALAIVYMLIVGGWQGLSDMYYGTIMFNVEYSIGRPNALWGNLSGNANYIYKVLLPLFPLLFFLRRDPNKILPVIVSTIITLFSLGGVHYHYLIVFIPLLAISISCITEPKWLWVFALAVSFIYGRTLYRQFDLQHFQFEDKDSEYVAFERVLSVVPEEERDSIWNMGGGFLVRDFKKARILQMNRMFLLFQLDISPKLYESEAYRIQRDKPQYIIGANFSESWWIDKVLSYTPRITNEKTMLDMEFVNHNYREISSAYSADGTKIICYKRNDL